MDLATHEQYFWSLQELQWTAKRLDETFRFVHEHYIRPLPEEILTNGSDRV